MKGHTLVLSAVVLAVALAGVSPKGAAMAPPPDQERQQTLVNGNNAFGLDLYSKLKAKDGNIFFSPFSISSALAMTYAGARGETEKQMAQTLRFNLGQAALHPAFADLVTQLVPADEMKAGYQLVIANALWGQKGFTFLPAFIELTGKYYGAALRELNFADNQAAAKVINDWVEQKTNQKITNLVPPDALNEMTRLVLTNAIYFKGQWKSPFEKEMTREEPFTLISGDKVNAPMMRHGPERLPYADLDTCRMLRLPYAGGRLSMLILLPKEVANLGQVESQLALPTLTEWMGKLQKAEVSVVLPKFTMTREFGLGPTLAELGMKDAFSAQDADFSGMDGKRDLFISAVLHKAFVDVNEEGTEAAAATGVMVEATAAPMRPIEFRADHPFIFMIRDDKTQSILFMGRVMNPKE